MPRCRCILAWPRREGGGNTRSGVADALHRPAGCLRQAVSLRSAVPPEQRRPIRKDTKPCGRERGAFRSLFTGLRLRIEKRLQILSTARLTADPGEARAVASVSMSRTVLSQRIRLMRGKRNARPLAWRLLSWIASKATSTIDPHPWFDPRRVTAPRQSQLEELRVSSSISLSVRPGIGLADGHRSPFRFARYRRCNRSAPCCVCHAHTPPPRRPRRRREIFLQLDRGEAAAARRIETRGFLGHQALVSPFPAQRQMLLRSLLGWKR